MPISATKVYLYAAQVGDLEKAFAAANVCGIPRQNVSGNFSTAWTWVQDGSNLVIAVGGAALYSLYYNPCGWSNPNGLAGGHTPFEIFPLGQGITSPVANNFVNAGGNTALDSLKLAVMLAYYAINGTFPYQYQGLPRQEVPQQKCVTGSSPSVTYPPVTPTPSPSPTPVPPVPVAGVGLYASVSSTNDVIHAHQHGWIGIGATGGLGAKASPYTQVLSAQPDKQISSALAQTGGAMWWLSFWTVSWPASGETFHDGGYKAGRYVAQTIVNLKGKYLPNYVIVDPEGYNTPADSADDWQDWLTGWADGITSVSKSLVPAFYCNQYQYSTYHLAAVELPAFIAVSPIAGNTPFVKGDNIEGYIAYYASCPTSKDVAQVKAWGGRLNTVQFRDSGVDCGP